MAGITIRGSAFLFCLLGGPHEALVVFERPGLTQGAHELVCEGRQDKPLLPQDVQHTVGRGTGSGERVSHMLPFVLFFGLLGS